MENAKKMKGLFITFLLILGTLSFSLVIPKTLGEGNNTLYVATDGTADYTSIQDAIDNASDGDTIFVFSGIYYENVVVNKSINLTGENRDTTIIDGSGIGDVVNITADGINISGFTIRNSSSGWGAGIKISSSNNTIYNCAISNNDRGTHVYNSNNNTISNCIISNNNRFGIRINYSSGNIIRGNIVKNNEIGIGLDCNDSIVADNIISNNTGIGILQGYASGNNTVYHNNFVNNTLQARDAYDNTWDNGYPSGGNYWSDFDEPSEGAWDNDSDGIVDAPYNISGGSSQDRYPLINPLDFIPPFTTCITTGTMGSNGWYVSNVSIELSATDNASEINFTMYCIDDGEWMEYVEPFNISSDGIHYIKFYSVDIPDNREKTRIKEIKIDKTIPTLSYYLQPDEPDGKDGWYLGNIEVTLYASDETSGVASILYKVDDNPWNAYTGYFLITTEGSHTFSFSSTDKAGNIVTKNTAIKIDKEPPAISITSPGTYVKGEVQIQWNASDSVDDNLNYSISLYLLQDNDSIEIASGINNTGTYEWNTALFPDFSSCKIKVVAEDDAGNTGFNTSDSFILDNTPPSVDIIQPIEGDVLGGNMLSIFWNASDNIDTNLDTIWIEYSDDGNTWKTIAKNIQNTATGYEYSIQDWENGNYMIKVNATDDAGNEGVAFSGNFTIDREAPTVKINKPKSGYLYINLMEKEILPAIPISFIPSPYNTIIVGKITVDISVTDEFSAINNVTILAGNTTVHLFDSPYTYEWNCPLGKHNLRVLAYDRAGNEGSAELKDILCINL